MLRGTGFGIDLDQQLKNFLYDSALIDRPEPRGVLIAGSLSFVRILAL